MQGYKRFIIRTLLALVPALLLVVLYVVRDPFRVVWPYDGHAYTPGDTIALTVNTGYVSTEGFKFYNPQRHYDSFIMGSSLSGYYRIDQWRRFLPDTASACHFNASRETLHGILNKLRYLADRDIPIRNVLIVMEDEMLERRPLDSHILYVQHPATASNVSWWDFHSLYFRAFRRPEIALYSFMPSLMAHRVLDKGYATTDIPDRIEPYNEGYYGWADSLIAVNPDAFYTPEHLDRYRLPDPLMPYPDKVTPEVELRLRNIAQLLQQHGTDYQIIIPPHYGYEAISANDLSAVERIFGRDRVHDYSHDPVLGYDLHYYYDDGHLIAAQCTRLMTDAYSIRPFVTTPASHQ